LALLFYVLKKQDYFLTSTLALPPETFTLVELVPFLVLTSTHQSLRLDVPSGFSSAAGASLVTSIVWLVVASGASSFPCKKRLPKQTIDRSTLMFSFFFMFMNI
jgi:hypothetical protein